MAYDEWLAERVSKTLRDKSVTFLDKKMMGGLCFMVDDKMCVGIVNNMLMARIGPEAYEAALEKDGVSEMDFTGRAMKGYVYIQPEAIDREEALSYWLDLCLAYNPLAKSSKKKRKQ